MTDLNTLVDLHLHTTASDGTLAPHQLIGEIFEAGIGLIAVTDHETMFNVEASKQEALRLGIAFLSGAELTAVLDDGKSTVVHILAYGVNSNDSALQGVMTRSQAAMEEVNRSHIQIMIEAGHPLCLHEYERYADDARRGGWKSLNYLVDKGLCSGVTDYLQRLFPPQPGDVKGLPSSEEVINAVKGAGGAAVLAHPGESIESASLWERLAELVEMGLEGIECYCVRHSKMLTDELLGWCEKQGLIVTGGSDYHGAFTKRQLGHPRVSLRQLRLGRIAHLVEW